MRVRSPWNRERGILLITEMMVLSGLFLLTSVGLSRSMTDLLAAQRSVLLHHAHHLAEAGLDAKLGQLTNADATDDDTAIPPTTIAYGTYEVRDVIRLTPTQWQFDAYGTARGVSRRLRLIVKKDTSPLPVPGVLNVVGEGTASVFQRFFTSSDPSLSKMVVDGNDFSNPGLAVAGAVLTTPTAYTKFTNDLTMQEGFYDPFDGFAQRLRGATPGYVSPGTGAEYSVRYQSQDENNDGTVDAGKLGYQMLNDLLLYAKTEAQTSGCYIDAWNDDTTSNNGPAGGNIVITNRTLGTVANPKVCFVDVTLPMTTDNRYVNQQQIEDAYFKGTNRGVGVLVVKGEIEVYATSSFHYDGIILSIGPKGELELRSQDFQEAIPKPIAR